MVLLPSSTIIRCVKFEKATEHEIADWFVSVLELTQGELVAALEKVHSMPKQSAQSGFKFGWSYGFLRGLLVANRVSFREPSPQRWMKDLNCRTGGDKNVTKQKAHERWPKFSSQITHAIADSLLLAEWVRLYGDK